MKEPAPHQLRVLNEKAELDDRTSKLRAFFDTELFSKLPETEKNLMKHQFWAMNEYSGALADRISAF
jgi:hypothetical protein